jgi:hypothetical protein
MKNMTHSDCLQLLRWPSAVALPPGACRGGRVSGGVVRRCAGVPRTRRGNVGEGDYDYEGT